MVSGEDVFALAILYPTMVLLIQQIYPVQTAATRTGVIISAATVADIVFNLLFGAVSSKWVRRAAGWARAIYCPGAHYNGPTSSHQPDVLIGFVA